MMMVVMLMLMLLRTVVVMVQSVEQELLHLFHARQQRGVRTGDAAAEVKLA